MSNTKRIFHRLAMLVRINIIRGDEALLTVLQQRAILKGRIRYSTSVNKLSNAVDDDSVEIFTAPI